MPRPHNTSMKKQNIKTQWDLKLLYKSPKDPQIEKDIQHAEKMYAAFEKKYKPKLGKPAAFLKNSQTLFVALSEYEKLLSLGMFKPVYYFEYIQCLDSKNSEARAQISKLQGKLISINNTLVFFELALSRIPKKDQKVFLKDSKLSHFTYYLQEIFKQAEYMLSEPEEKILSMKSLTSRALWIDNTQKILNKQTVEYKGKQIPVSEAGLVIHELPTQSERKELHEKQERVLMSLADVAESEINAVYTDKKANDELRGYEKSYDATILRYGNDRKSVLNLVKTVTEHFYVAHRFFKIKAKIFGLKKMYYSDRAAKITTGKHETNKITFAHAYTHLHELFTRLDPEFGVILKQYVEKGQIDAYPKVGKQSGAFCSPYADQPTLVLLNHTDTFDSLRVFAHEMGHAIHSEYCRTQSLLYRDVSMSTAEVASTLFEAFVFEDYFKTLSDEEKIVALHDKIHNDIQTIFRQIACFNFEVELHEQIREKGALTAQEIAKLMNTHMKAYLGPLFEMHESDGYFFVTWSHIRNFFYVYSYGFGQLMSKALHAKYVENPAYMTEIKKFLSLGGSMSPEDIFRSIGVDVTKPDFFKKGIESIEEDIATLEKLVI